MPVPHVPPGDRLVIDDLGYRDDGITHVAARFGYMERPERPGRAPPVRGGRASRARSRSTAPRTSCPRSSCTPATSRGCARWRKRLFVATSRIADDAAEYFGLPQRPDDHHGVPARGVTTRTRRRRARIGLSTARTPTAIGSPEPSERGRRGSRAEGPPEALGSCRRRRGGARARERPGRRRLRHRAALRHHPRRADGRGLQRHRDPDGAGQQLVRGPLRERQDDPLLGATRGPSRS